MNLTNIKLEEAYKLHTKLKEDFKTAESKLMGAARETEAITNQFKKIEADINGEMQKTQERLEKRFRNLTLPLEDKMKELQSSVTNSQESMRERVEFLHKIEGVIAYLGGEAPTSLLDDINSTEEVREEEAVVKEIKFS